MNSKLRNRKSKYKESHHEIWKKKKKKNYRKKQRKINQSERNNRHESGVKQLEKQWENRYTKDKMIKSEERTQSRDTNGGEKKACVLGKRS